MGVGVFILGMHRSGTSVATRAVNLLGVSTAIDVDLVQPRPENPTGYWESASLVAVNTRLLDAVGSETGCPAILPSGWEQSAPATELRDAARSVVERVLPVEPWVWKDPRNCLTFLFWASALDVRPVVVLMNRNPLEIAASLHARDGESTVYGLALWERYLRSALGAITGLPVLVTSYEDLLADPPAWCKRTEAFLNAEGVATLERDDARLLDVVDVELRHARFTRADVLDDAVVSDAQRVLYVALQDLASSHARFSSPGLPPESPTTEPLLAERRRAVQLKHELRRLQERERLSPPWRRLGGRGEDGRTGRILAKLQRKPTDAS